MWGTNLIIHWSQVRSLPGPRRHSAARLSGPVCRAGEGRWQLRVQVTSGRFDLGLDQEEAVGEVRPPEICPAEVGAPEVGDVQVRPPEVRSEDVVPDER